MEVLYHIRPYFGGIFPYIGLKDRPYIGLIYGRYLQFRILLHGLMVIHGDYNGDFLVV